MAGRPALPPGQALTRLVRVPLRPAVHDSWRVLARSEGISLAEFIRRKVTDYLEREAEWAEEVPK